MIEESDFFQIEYHCPDCGSITPLLMDIVACIGCGKPLEIIQVAADDDDLEIEEPVNDPRLN